MKEENSKFLGEEKVSKLLIKFAIPCILSMLISSLYNIVDQIFIGNSSLGFLGNAATGVVFPITIVTMAFAWCFGDGAAAFLSLCQGRKDTKDIHISVGNAILASLMVSIILMIIGFIFMDNLLYMFGASSSSIGLARDYFRILLYAFPFYMIGNTLNPVIRADGSPKFSSAVTFAGAITNIILDPIFIFGLDMGIKGAAIATIMGEILTFILSIIYLKKTKTFKLSKSSFKVNNGIFKNAIKLGISTFITQMAIVVISLVCNIMLAKYGSTSKYGADIPIAVIGIVMKVFSILISIVIGVAVGAQPIFGYNYGAKKYDRVKSLYRLVITIVLIVSLISTLVFELFPEVIISIFGIESDLYLEFAVSTFRIFLMLVTFTCLIKVTSIFFQAVGMPTRSAIVSLFRDIVCFVPLVIFLPKAFEIKGVLYAAPIADFIGFIVTLAITIPFIKKMSTSSVNQIESEEVIKQSKKGVIITIAREHGSQGKYIGELIAKKLGIPYYYKEMVSLAAKESGLDKDFISKLNDNDDALRTLYLTTSPVKYAIEAQEAIIKKIAENGSCVIVGRAADYVLRDNKDVVSIFIHAPKDYRVKNVMQMYSDVKDNSIKYVEKSDKARSTYYKAISSKNWNDSNNYNLSIDSSIGAERTAQIICEYLKVTGKIK